MIRYAAIWEKSPSSPWQARHGLTSQEYQKAVDTLLAQGFRLIQVSGYVLGDSEMYSALWNKSPGPPWAARHGLTSAQYQNEVDTLNNQGYRPVNVSGYTVGEEDHYAAIFEKRTSGAWVARHGLTSGQYQTEFDRLTSQGYRLVDVSGYTVHGEDRYAAIWEVRDGPAWQARHGMTSAQYQAEFNKLAQQGYRPIQVRGWKSSGEPHFAAIWIKDQVDSWVARHGILASAYQEEFDARLKQGFRLRFISGYNAFE